LFETARRDGVPINRTAIIANAADGRLPQQISAHDPEEHRRTILATDLIHASVRIEPGSTKRPCNNPHVPLARIDDAGRIQEVV
jgi:hypothetical protein